MANSTCNPVLFTVRAAPIELEHGVAAEVLWWKVAGIFYEFGFQATHGISRIEMQHPFCSV